jgi:hypothetical protein
MSNLVKCWRCETLGPVGDICKGCQSPVSEYAPVERRRSKPSTGNFVPPTPERTSSHSASQMPAKPDAAKGQPRDIPGELLQQIAENTSKTKHAVRAFVRFLFIQLTFTTLALPLYNLAFAETNAVACALTGKSCEPNTYLFIAAVLVWLTGTFLSSQAGWSELRKSD